MKQRRVVPDKTFLLAHLHYDPETGAFTRARDCGKWKTGQPMGTISKDGYLNINIDYQIIRAHRIAWTYMTGEQPPEYLDHVNGMPLDNRWCNIRESTQTENLFNKRGHRNSVTGVKGVSLDKRSGRYRARVQSHGVIVFERFYDSLVEAKAARDAAAKVYHESFFRS